MNEKVKFRAIESEERLVSTDQMRRSNGVYASNYDWFDLPECDIGKKAGYFAGSGFLLRRPVRETERK